jgi:hypothetical protein
MSFGQGPKTTTTGQQTTQSGVGGPAAQPTQDLLNSATSWLNSGGAQYYPGQTYAGLNSTQQSGIGQLTAGGNSGAAQSYFSNLINGGTLDPSQNPTMQAQLDAIKQSVMPAINSSFAKAGMYGSTPNQEALAQGLASGEAAPIFQNYQYQQGLQNQAAAGAPTMAAQIAQNTLNAGALQQQDAQNQINADMARWNYNQNLPLQTTQQAAGIIDPLASMYKTGTTDSTQTQSTQQSPLQTALGLGMMGASMFGTGGMFPGVGAGLGSAFSSMLPTTMAGPWRTSVTPGG